MSRGSRALVIVAAALAGLAAITSIAGARGRSEDAREASRLAALVAVDEAIARQDLAVATRAGRQARELGMRSRGWQGPMQAADAELRLGAAGARDAAPMARELYLIALFRARAEGSVDGALAAAEGFARLGDHEAAVGAAHIASRAAVRSGDADAAARALLVRERLMRRTADAVDSIQITMPRS